jgi:transcription initiation factor IIE alpha subunit
MSQPDLFRWGDDRPWSPKRASVEALEALPLATVREDHRRILEALRPGSLTDAELQEATGIHPNAIRARRGELREAGLIRVVGKRQNASGRNCTTWGLA